MLMQNFKPAADLGISEAQKEALMKTLVLLETGRLDYCAPGYFTVDPQPKLSGKFNMEHWADDSGCGTVACIGGTAELVAGQKVFGGVWGEWSDGLSGLFCPKNVASWGAVTPTQAARALRSYLTTGDAKWAEAVSVRD